MCTADDYLPSDLHGTCCPNGCTDLPNEYHRSGLPDPSIGGCSLCHLVGYGIREWRLQWSFDEQQHRCACCLRRFDYGDLYLYERLCTNDDDLPSDLHGTCGTNGKLDLPNEYHRSGGSVSSSGEYCLCDLVGFCIRKWRLQRGVDEQQHGSAIGLWRFHYGDLHLYEFLCTAYYDLSGDLYGSNYCRLCFN